MSAVAPGQGKSRFAEARRIINEQLASLPLEPDSDLTEARRTISALPTIYRPDFKRGDLVAMAGRLVQESEIVPATDAERAETYANFMLSLLTDQEKATILSI